MQNLDKKAIKSGVLYTLSSFLTKGIVFLTTPFFSRMMSIEAFGEFSAFSTWQSLLLCVLPLGLDTTITRARLDFPGKLDAFMSTLTLFSFGFTAFSYVIVLLFSDFFCSFFEMDIRMVHIMFIYMMLYPAMSIYQGKNAAEFRYKVSTIISTSSALLSVFAGMAFVMLFEDQAFGRALGQNGVYIAFFVALFVCIILKGRAFQVNYLTYALRIALPLVPHIVSMYILASSDKLIIQKMCGSQALAFYNIGFTCAVVISMLSNSVNNAMSPWLFERLQRREYERIKAVNRCYILAFVFVTVGLLIVAPEIMLVIGGEKYREAQSVLMPIMAGCCCNFIYTSYVNVELYLKKSGGISIGTAAVAIINLVLNVIFVRMYGYEAAAYTTMVCYVLLLLYHYGMVRKYKYHVIYDNKLNLLCAFGICAFGVVMRITFRTPFRMALFVVYTIVLISMIVKFRKRIISMLKSIWS